VDEVRTIPQRELRNNVSEVLRQVQAGAHLRITVNGRPVADLVPVRERRREFVPFEGLWASLDGLLERDDPWPDEIRADRDDDDLPADPFERHPRAGR
jgi:prevent-host-death family protein